MQLHTHELAVRPRQQLNTPVPSVSSSGLNYLLQILLRILTENSDFKQTKGWGRRVSGCNTQTVLQRLRCEATWKDLGNMHYLYVLLIKLLCLLFSKTWFLRPKNFWELTVRKGLGRSPQSGHLLFSLIFKPLSFTETKS